MDGIASKDVKAHKIIQEKWKEGKIVGYDCIGYGDGTFTIANTYSFYNPNKGETKQYWTPTCDTTFDSIIKYNDDIWTDIDIYQGAFEYKNQKFVFGERLWVTRVL